MAGGSEWLADLEANYDEADRAWVVHERHLIAVRFAYGPTGGDVERELEAFANAVRDGRSGSVG